MYVCSRIYKYVLTKILLTFKCICAQEDFINFKCICAQEDYTFYQKFLGVPTLGVNTKTRRRRAEFEVWSIYPKSVFSRILGSKVGVRVVYSCRLYKAVYGR